MELSDAEHNGVGFVHVSSTLEGQGDFYFGTMPFDNVDHQTKCDFEQPLWSTSPMMGSI